MRYPEGFWLEVDEGQILAGRGGDGDDEDGPSRRRCGRGCTRMGQPGTRPRPSGRLAH